MSVFVVRAFIRLRESVANHREITTKLEQLETKVNSHDAAISQLFNVIRQLTQSTTAVQRRIGFAPKERPKSNALKRKAAD